MYQKMLRREGRSGKKSRREACRKVDGKFFVLSHILVCSKLRTPDVYYGGKELLIRWLEGWLGARIGLGVEVERKISTCAGN